MVSQCTTHKCTRLHLYLFRVHATPVTPLVHHMFHCTCFLVMKLLPLCVCFIQKFRGNQTEYVFCEILLLLY
jgi:hypothetical protein